MLKRWSSFFPSIQQIRVSLLSIILIYIAHNSCHAADSVEVYPLPLSNPIPRQIRFNLTIENPSGKSLANQVIWLYAPVKRTATQQLEKLDISVPYQLLEDELGNQIIKLQFNHFPPYATKIVSIRADLLLSAIPTPSELRRTDLFLGEEKYVEKNHPLIQTTAGIVKAPSISDTAEGIFQWVKSHLNYAGYIADELGAAYAITNKIGDCTEYAYLATALARANRIYARALGGYVIDRNSAPKSDEYHNWAEVHIDGTWHLLDAQKGNYRVNSERYVAMRIISQGITNPLNSAHRFRVEGDVVVRMN